MNSTAGIGACTSLEDEIWERSVTVRGWSESGLVCAGAAACESEEGSEEGSDDWLTQPAITTASPSRIANVFMV